MLPFNFGKQNVFHANHDIPLVSSLVFHQKCRIIDSNSLHNVNDNLYIDIAYVGITST